MATLFYRNSLCISCRFYSSVHKLTGSLNPKRYLLAVPGNDEEVLDILKVRRLLKDIVGNESREVKEVISQTDLPKRSMIDSYRKSIIPLGSNPKFFRNSYSNFVGRVRIGKILEALDTMAVWIGYTHNAQIQMPISIVTAFVDNIVLRQNSLANDADMTIEGHVTWVGQTSMAVSMDVKQVDKAGSWSSVLDAHFVMVARDPNTKKKAFVCPLSIQSAEEEFLFDQGKDYMAVAKEQSHESLLNQPPNPQEIVLIHDLFKTTLDPKSATFRNPKKPEGIVWMETTKLKNLIICFPEQRNLYNKIFGGFLMRAAYELGWATATMHCKAPVNARTMDDIMFRKPVEIGSLLYLSAVVVYTLDKKLQVRVHAEVVNPNTGEQDTTNVFHFMFESDNNVPTVMPKSYSEYMLYLDGKRHFDQHV